ncbi:reverse transcriptase domain-containing protein [Tanacetum coccineum]
MMFPLSLMGEAKTWLDELNEGTIKTWDELQTAFISRFFPPALFDRLLREIRAFSQHENETLTEAWLRMKKRPEIAMKTVAFAEEGSSNSDTNKIMTQMDAMTMIMDAHYKEFKSHSKQPDPDHNDDDTPMSCEEEAKFKQTFRRTRFYNDYRDRDLNCDNWHSSGRNNYNKDNYQSHSDDKPDLKKQLSDFIKAHTRPILLLADKQSGRPSGSLPGNTQPNPKAAFQSDESSALIQNKVPLKLEDPGSFFIPCNFDKAFSCDALADLGASINLMSYFLYAKLSLKTLKPTKMSVRLADISFQYHVGIAKNMLVEVGKFTFPVDFVILEMEKDSKVPLIIGRPFLHTIDVVTRVKQKQLNLGVGTEHMTFYMDSAMKHSYSNDDTCFSIEGSEILYSIEGAILKEKLIAEFDKFMEMTADENSESEFDTEETRFKNITFNTDYKIKTSLEEPITNLELKPLPNNLKYAFLEEPSFLPVIISSQLSVENKKNSFLSLKDTSKPLLGKPQTFLESVPDSPWVSPIHYVPKKGGITVVTNEKDELVPTRTVTGWRVCIDYRKLNEATAKDHFPLPFMDQILERLTRNKYFCFLDGFSGYFQILIDPMDQEKTTFTCPFGTYAYCRMPFGLCNAPANFQRYMLAIFHYMIEESVEVFMDDFSIFGNSFNN